MDAAALHRRARESGVNPVVYWLVRAVIQPFFHVWFRLVRTGHEHIPDGPVLIVANHRSFLDPFIVGTCLRRPIYYVAKKELFANRLQGWFLNSLGAFPVDRGGSDGEMVETAKAILARGDSVVIFPEGTRTRPGPLGRPKRGAGRLALEAGVPVVPVALTGTEAVRTGWRIRPHKVQVRVGRPLTFPAVEQVTHRLAAAVTTRIWACVALQWEWLGGMPPLRRATVIGGGYASARVRRVLERAGLEVDFVSPQAHADLSGRDLVCFTGPEALTAYRAEIPEGAGVLLVRDEPTADLRARPARRAASLLLGPEPQLECPDPALARQLAPVLEAADGGRARDRAAA
jgi:glycerol-3-phosphate dehydrogenase (NAD(P)+)